MALLDRHHRSQAGPQKNLSPFSTYDQRRQHLLLVGVLISLLGLAACKNSDKPQDGTTAPTSCRPIPNTPLCWKLPTGWSVEAAVSQGEESQGPKSAIQTALPDAGLVDNAIAKEMVLLDTRLLAQGRGPQKLGALLQAKVEVYQSELAPGTSATDFLAANRLAQQKALSQAPIRHLEVEPVTQQKRRGFIVRDAFDVPVGPQKKIPVSQQALLLVDKQKGYVLVITMLKEDLMPQLPVLRAWLQSVRFAS